MESKTKLQRRSLSLGNMINKKRNTQIQKQQIEENNENQMKIEECSSIADDKFIDKAECTPPRKKYSLDESIEYSPGYLNFSFSPGSVYSQTVGANSEVSWQWGNNNNRNTEATSSYSALADNNFQSAENKAKELARCAKSKREEYLREIEHKIRRAESLRVDAKFKGYCAIFKEKLWNSETQMQKDSELNIEKCNNVLEETRIKNDNIVQTEPIKSNTAINFFDDSAEDDFLLEATEKVEHEFIRLTQSAAVVQTEVSSANNSNNNSMERRTSMYSKFFEDDAQDDFFGDFDDIIEQAMQTSKPRTSFQRFNSLPTESMSTKTKTSEMPKEVPITSKAQKSSSTVTQSIKRHASSENVPVFHPYKMKQIKRC